ncbi:Papain-like cysteine peptidase superfamily [Sesbania bispinosa]|nr:Papain-like cysteine peptidase superfamily [Sesbania bispinosa]
MQEPTTMSCGASEECEDCSVMSCAHNKLITSLQHTIEGLCCSVTHLTDMIKGMGIHLQQQDLKSECLMEVVKQLQTTMEVHVNELQKMQTTAQGCESGKKTPSRSKTQVPNEAKARSKLKTSRREESEEDRFAILLELSDDEDAKYHQSGKSRTPSFSKPPTVPGFTVKAFAQTERDRIYGRSPSTKFSVKLGHSEYGRNASNKEGIHPKGSLDGKNPPFSPLGQPEEERTTKVDEILERCTPMKRLPTDSNFSSENSSKRKVGSGVPVQKMFQSQKGHVLPEYMETKFKVLPEMLLSVEELYVAAYVFHPHEDLNEEILLIGNTRASLVEFESLSPDKVPWRKIVMLIAAKITWMEESEKCPSVWCLPPSFHDDVRMGLTTEDLIDKYMKDWMPIYNDLKYIYVPIEDIAGQWYLMLVSIQDKVIYNLDPYIEQALEHSRRETIRNVAIVIAQVIGTEYYPPNFAIGKLQLDAWEISDAFSPSTGPAVTESELISKSILWVMDWLYMRNAFQPNISREMNQEVLRMKVALDLLCGKHNQYWPMLQMKSKAFWAQQRFERLGRL